MHDIYCTAAAAPSLQPPPKRRDIRVYVNKLQQSKYADSQHEHRIMNIYKGERSEKEGGRRKAPSKAAASRSDYETLQHLHESYCGGEKRSDCGGGLRAAFLALLGGSIILFHLLRGEKNQDASAFVTLRWHTKGADDESDD